MPKIKPTQKKTMRTDGALPQNTGKITNLEQLFARGAAMGSRYGFLKDPFDAAQYEDYLRALGEADLMTHAQEHNFAYLDDKPRVIKKLMAEFIEYNRSRNTVLPEAPKQKAPSDDLKRIMSYAK